MSIRAAEVVTTLFARVEGIVQQRVGCGVLILTSALRIWFMDAEARRLIQRLRPRGGPEPGEHWIPQDIRSLSQSLLATRDTRRSLKRRDDISLKRVVAWKSDVLLLRGVLLPSFEVHGTAALLILLERILLERAGQSWDDWSLQQFSLREKAILGLLAQGSTDKEMASTLGLSLYTVREYVRNMMVKTSSRTRTALVANVLMEHDPAQGKRLRLLATISESHRR